MSPSIPSHGFEIDHWADAMEATTGWWEGCQHIPNNFSTVQIVQDGISGGGQSQWGFFIHLVGVGNSTSYEADIFRTGQGLSTQSNALLELEDFLADVFVINLTPQELVELTLRLFYVLNWLYLADLGQITNYYEYSYIYGDMGNVFVNESLYLDYLGYFHTYPDAIWPYNASVEELKSSFSPLQPVDTMIVQNYACQQRQLKGGVSLLTSVIIADYPFIVGGFTLVIWMASAFQKRQKEGNASVLTVG
jgi:hypothetical protein